MKRVHKNTQSKLKAKRSDWRKSGKFLLQQSQKSKTILAAQRADNRTKLQNKLVKVIPVTSVSSFESELIVRKNNPKKGIFQYIKDAFKAIWNAVKGLFVKKKVDVKPQFGGAKSLRQIDHMKKVNIAAIKSAAIHRRRAVVQRNVAKALMERVVADIKPAVIKRNEEKSKFASVITNINSI